MPSHPPAPRQDLPTSTTQHFFAPHTALTLAGGSVRGEKMRPPHTTDDIQSRTYGSNTRVLAASSGVGITPTTFYPCQPHSGQSLFTAFARRRSGEARTGAHPSDTRFPKGTPGTVTAAPTRLTRPQTHESSQDIPFLRWLLLKSASLRPGSSRQNRLLRPREQALLPGHGLGPGRHFAGFQKAP
jgi:hypothetical protein